MGFVSSTEMWSCATLVHCVPDLIDTRPNALWGGVLPEQDQWTHYLTIPGAWLQFIVCAKTLYPLQPYPPCMQMFLSSNCVLTFQCWRAGWLGQFLAWSSCINSKEDRHIKLTHHIETHDPCMALHFDHPLCSGVGTGVGQGGQLPPQYWQVEQFVTFLAKFELAIWMVNKAQREWFLAALYTTTLTFDFDVRIKYM